MRRPDPRTLLPLVFLTLVSLARAGSTAPAASDILDPKADPRLERHVLLRSEGVPVAHVLRRLGEKSGVVLTAPGQPGDERLIAFVADAPVAEIMRSIAELYRLRWVRGGTADRPTYQLLKPIAAQREEAALKQRALDAALAEVDRQLREPNRNAPTHRDTDGHFTALRVTAAEIIRGNWDRLAADGHLELPVSELPEHQKNVLLAHGPAALQITQREVHESEIRSREFYIQHGLKLPDSLKEIPQPRPVPPVEACKLSLDLNATEGLEFNCMLSTPAFATTLVTGRSKQAENSGIQLYADRHPRPTLSAPNAGGAAPAPDPPLPPDDPLGRPLVVAPGALIESSHLSTPWLTAMENVANLAHVAVYSDDYSNPEAGEKQRTAEPPRNDQPASDYLDELGRQRDREAPPCFWWRRGSAVLLRSRSFLQEADSVLPVSLAEGLVTHGRLHPGKTEMAVTDLLALSRLTPVQLRGVTRGADPIPAWKRAVQLPVRLGAAARGLVVADGLTWERMTEPDRELARRLSGGMVGPTYQAHVTAGLTHPSWRSKSGVQIRLETDLTPGSGYQLMVPAPQLNPQGLLVTDPARAHGSGLPLKRRVIALYYPWYGLEAVGGKDRKVERANGKIRNFAHDPAAGPYDSTDEAVIRRQLHQMHDAGVDAVACYWPGPGTFEDRALHKLLPLAKAEGLPVCLSLDDVKAENALDFRNKLSGWLKELCADPNYLRVEGKPVLFMGYSLQEKFTLQEWADLFESLDKSVPPGVFSVIPGFTQLDSMLFSATNTNAHLSWEIGAPSTAIARGARDMMAHGMAAVAEVSPGFDVRHLDKDSSPIDRADGAYYRALWDAAVELRPDWVLIDSFNQWETGTEIEPSREYGDTYLKLTAEYAARFKAPVR